MITEYAKIRNATYEMVKEGKMTMKIVDGEEIFSLVLPKEGEVQ